MYKKIALILPYFGKLENYFQLWLMSASYNKQVDFLVFTNDITIKKLTIPDNVHYYEMDFQYIKDRLSDILPYPFILHEPYKLCDYRPLYGLIFSEYLKKYDFWGHCDADVIWGDLSTIFDHIDFDKYDRINELGHLCIYRNEDFVNSAVLQAKKITGIKAQDVYAHKYSAHFDESALLRKYMQLRGVREYSESSFADLSYFKKQFICMVQGMEKEKVLGFKFIQGKLLGYCEDTQNNIYTKEYSYVHLQKRNMEMAIKKFDNFWIIPNLFLDDLKITNVEELRQYGKPSKKYEKMQIRKYRKRQIGNILNGAMYFRIKNIIK